MNNSKTLAGYAAVTGLPNVGKSTLLNSILGTKLSIVTPKPQTTRKRVLGIFTSTDTQIIFLDNPGVVKPNYELHRSMMGYINESLADSDIILSLIDVSNYRDLESSLSKEFLMTIEKSEKPKILVINKIDLLKDIREVLPVIESAKKYNIFDEFVAVSALKNAQTDELIKTVKNYLPESPFFYDPEMLSTQPERFFVSEIIREHIFRKFRQEVPYSTEVHIIDFREREGEKWFISAEIIVERATQKAIMIGAKGQQIKKIGEVSRKDIEEHLGMPVFLELFVKVREKWRDNPNLLQSYGY